MRDRFVTFEGGEGSGKSTQVRMLAATLRARGQAVTLTREPGGSPLGERLRTFLLDPTRPRIGAAAEALLFAAARADHLSKVVLPAVARGEVVLCDRFSDSTYAYQGDEVGTELLDQLHAEAVGEDGPCLTLLLDVDVRAGHERVRRRRGNDVPDRFEQEGVDFHERLRDRYLRIAQAAPDRVVVVDVSKTPEEVASDVIGIVLGRIGP